MINHESVTKGDEHGQSRSSQILFWKWDGNLQGLGWESYGYVIDLDDFGWFVVIRSPWSSSQSGLNHCHCLLTIISFWLSRSHRLAEFIWLWICHTTNPSNYSISEWYNHQISETWVKSMMPTNQSWLKSPNQLFSSLWFASDFHCFFPRSTRNQWQYDVPLWIRTSSQGWSSQFEIGELLYLTCTSYHWNMMILPVWHSGLLKLSP